MAKSVRRQKIAKEKKSKKEAQAKAQKNPGGESNYAHKRRYLDRAGVCGADVPEPKPWKKT